MIILYVHWLPDIKKRIKWTLKMDNNDHFVWTLKKDKMVIKNGH